MSKEDKMANKGIARAAKAKKRVEAIERQLRNIERGYYICGWKTDAYVTSGRVVRKCTGIGHGELIVNEQLKAIGKHVHGHKPRPLSKADQEWYDNYKRAHVSTAKLAEAVLSA
jgi:hypothetical protein